MEYLFISVTAGIRNEEIYGRTYRIATDYPHDSYEIIIVDGMYTDKTWELVQKCSVRLILNKIKMLRQQETLAQRTFEETLLYLRMETARSILYG